MEDKTLYRYEYNLGQITDVKVSETDAYRVQIDEAGVFINNLGVYEFYMYSYSKDNVKMFLSQISKILLNEADVAANLSRLAHGRFFQFDKYWKQHDEQNKEALEDNFVCAVKKLPDTVSKEEILELIDKYLDLY